MNRIVLVLIVCTLANAQIGSDPLVSIAQGVVRGVRADDGDYVKFLGIPYALVNTTNPFGPALPHLGFDNIFEANDDSTVCPQLTTTGEIAGVLQCLQLHIYVPDTAGAQNLLPVMVYIHAGGFAQGSAAGEYPKSLIQNDVIVVSISHRLGIYGFMCLDTPELPGNEGFRDQVLAFRWIKENIEAFGGDPTSITAFGQSAGGMAISAHMYSEYEKLFDRAVIQSGPALSVWFFVPSLPEAPFVLAEYLSYQATDLNDALSYLATVEPLVLTASAYATELLSTGSKHKIKPCIEKRFEGVQHFITEHPMNIKAAPKVNSTSIMIGNTDEEMGVEFYPPPEDGNYDNFEDMLYLAFARDEALDGTVELIKNFYVGDEEVFGINLRKETADFTGDFIFAHPTQRMAEKFIDNGAAAVYRYVFSYIGDKNVTGASHGTEVPFLFDRYQFAPVFNKTEKDQRVADQTMKLWSNFAKYGNPTPEVTDLLPVEWKPATNEEQFSLDINSQLTLVSRPEYERMTFWDLFFEEYEQYQLGYNEYFN